MEHKIICSLCGKTGFLEVKVNVLECKHCGHQLILHKSTIPAHELDPFDFEDNSYEDEVDINFIDDYDGGFEPEG